MEGEMEEHRNALLPPPVSLEDQRVRSHLFVSLISFLITLLCSVLIAVLLSMRRRFYTMLKRRQ